jgi:hypothetical protein
MQEEATQELASAELHLTVLATVGVVLPAEGDVLSVKGQQSVVGNGHAMGVAAQIAQHLERAAKGWLGVDDPILTVHAAKQLRELPRISERGRRACTMEFVAAVQMFQASQEFSAKDATKNFYRQKELVTSAKPTTVARR